MNANSNHSEIALAHGAERSGLAPAVVKVFLLLGLVVVANQMKPLVPADWLASGLVAVGMWAAVASLVPVLPWPNALLAAGLAVFIGGMLEAVSAVTGLPFGKRESMSKAGIVILGLIPWWLPLVWGIFALSARGTARLILYHDRERPYHGYRVIVLAAMLAMASVMGLEIFASVLSHFSESSRTPVWGYICLFAAHLLIQVAATPLLIDKFPGRRPRNFLPLWVWGAVNLLLVAGIVECAMRR